MQLSGQDWSALPRGPRQWIPVVSGVPQKISFAKVLGLMQLAEVRMLLFQSQWEFSFYPLSKIRETKELGHHEENVTGSSVESRDFVATACSLYPQTDLIQRNLSTAKPFSWQYPTPFPLCGSTRLQFYADKMSGLHLSPSLLPVEKPASAFLMKDLLCTQICGEGTRST